MVKKKSVTEGTKPVNLKVLAEYLNLSPATVSLVMNNAPGVAAIAATTRHRVLEAAKRLDYRPNPIARSLRTRQTFTVGVIVPEFSEGYFTMLMNGIEEHLLQSGYLHFVVSHQGKQDLIDEYPRLLSKRAVDGFLLVNTSLNEEVSAPVISISGHKKIKGNTNIMLDHDRAALLALKHLYDLGHRRIAFMKGQPQVSDSAVRWEGIMAMAQRVGPVRLSGSQLLVTGARLSHHPRSACAHPRLHGDLLLQRHRRHRRHPRHRRRRSALPRGHLRHRF
jgi:LacI family transcriptional regulator